MRILLVMSVLAICHASPAQPPQRAQGSSSARTIVELRRQIEGQQPSRSTLRSGDSDLAAEIDRLSSAGVPPTPSPPAAESWGQPPRLFHDSPDSPGGGFAPQPAQPHSDNKRLLRDTAYRLDTLAHELELRDLCGQADQLRQVASRLRQDARRRLAPPSRVRGGVLPPTPAPFFAPDPGPAAPFHDRAAEPPPSFPGQLSFPRSPGRPLDPPRPRPAASPEQETPAPGVAR